MYAYGRQPPRLRNITITCHDCWGRTRFINFNEHPLRVCVRPFVRSFVSLIAAARNAAAYNKQTETPRATRRVASRDDVHAAATHFVVYRVYLSKAPCTV